MSTMTIDTVIAATRELVVRDHEQRRQELEALVAVEAVQCAAHAAATLEQMRKQLVQDTGRDDLVALTSAADTLVPVDVVNAALYDAHTETYQAHFAAPEGTRYVVDIVWDYDHRRRAQETTTSYVVLGRCCDQDVRARVTTPAGHLNALHALREYTETGTFPAGTGHECATVEPAEASAEPEAEAPVSANRSWFSKLLGR